MPTLDFITVDPSQTHSATVIFLHGLGDSGYGWKPLAESFAKDSGLTHVKWVLPHAPGRAITVNHGEVMPAWYDIKAFGMNNKESDEEGMMETVRAVRELIDLENANGIPYSRIVLGGFSQGAAITLLVGLTGDSWKKLAGLAPLSGPLPLRYKFNELISPHATSIPIFWGTGSADPLVTLELAEKSIELLQTLGLTVTRGSKDYKAGLAFNVYSGLKHSTDPFELVDLKGWLKKAVPPT